MRIALIQSAALFLLLLAPGLEAARCKVEGQWYDYDSPQCGGKDSGPADSRLDGANPETNDPPKTHRSNEAPGQSRPPMAAFRAGPLEPPPGFAIYSEVVTFRVRPPDSRDAPLIVGPPPDPEPLDVRQRTARLVSEATDAEVLDAAVGQLEAEAEYTVLSAAIPHIEGLASLRFVSPGSVHSDSGAWFTGQDRSFLLLALSVEAGRVYLLDFVVRGSEPGSYLLRVGSDEHVFEDVGGALRNVTARLVAERTGQVHVRLQRYGRGFSFHAAAITSIAATGLFAAQDERAVAGPPPDRSGNP